MKGWKDVLSSAVFRLIVIVLAVVIPLNLLTLILGNTVIGEVERQVSLETQNALQMYMNQIDDAIARINVSMYTVAHEDANFSRLHYKEVSNTDEYYKQVESVVYLSNTLDDILEVNTLIGGLYACFPEKNLFLTRGGTSQQSTAVKTYVQETVVSEAEESLQSWKLVTASVEPLLLIIVPYRQCFYGAWIPLRTLAEKIGLYENSDRTVKALTNGAGEIYLANQDTAEHLDLTAITQDYNGESYTLVRAESARSPLCYVQALSKDQISNALPIAIRVLQILSIVAVIIIPVIIIAIRRWIIRPVNLLTEAMSRIEQGDVDYRIPQNQVGSEFDRINRHFNRMMDEVSELKISVYEQKIKNEKIRLGFLSRQIQPHFILNTLNILYSYEPEEYMLSRKMILCLSKYFRYVVNANADFVELGQEMEHIRNYFEIQQARFLNAFRAQVRCEKKLARCLIPPLIVQNFTENAIKYALLPGQIVEITAEAWSEGDRLHLRVSDTGSGITDEVLERIEKFRESREFRDDLGMGIQNAIDRLELLYGSEASLELSRREPHGTQINVVLPIRYKEAEFDESDLD